MITFTSLKQSMEGKRKIARIRLLMIVSHLLLTVFVVQWLVSRYGQEKTTLKRDLSREFAASEDKSVDSMLLKNVVNPFLYSNRNNHVKMLLMSGKKSDSTKLKDLNMSNIEKQAFIKGLGISRSISEVIKGKLDSNATIYTTIARDTLKQGDDTIYIKQKAKDLSEKFLLRSIKVLSSKVADSLNNKHTITLSFASGVDSVMVIKDFEKRELVKNFNLVWGKKGDSTKDSSDMRIVGNIAESALVVDIQGYQFYLLKKISPQIFFGLVLLLLTGSAFVISFVSLKKQTQLNKIRNEFVSNITHELKTPVSTVKVALEALQSFNQKDEPQKVDEYIRIAQMEMNRLDQLIQKVLTTSVYEEAKDIMSFEPINLKELVDEVIKSMQLRLSSLKARVDVDFENDAIVILGDRLHIQGVIINLIDNSLKYVDTNPVISIKAACISKQVQLSVADNGIGIPSDYLSKVFDKFFRVPSDNKHNVKGYGLGLSYAAMVMRQHNGSISVENRSEGGCIFTLTFPQG